MFTSTSRRSAALADTDFLDQQNLTCLASASSTAAPVKPAARKSTRPVSRSRPLKNSKITKQKHHLMKTITKNHLSFVAVVLASFGLLPGAQAVVPAPDGGYPGFTTAEGQNALKSLSTGQGNTAVGWFSLFSATTTCAQHRGFKYRHRRCGAFSQHHWRRQHGQWSVRASS